MDPDSKLRIAVTDGRGRPVAAGGLARWLARVAPLRARGDVAIALVSNRQIQDLNRRYRRKDKPTDVLSFPAETVGQGLSPDRVNPVGQGFGPDRAKPVGQGATPDRVKHVGQGFSPDTPLGDIAIATGIARRQARAAGHPYETELRVLALHGLLHLIGYDHDDPADNGRMARAEARLRRKGGLHEGLIEREVAAPSARATRRGSRARTRAGSTRRK